MFNRIIVPTDGSDAAWRAVVVGDRLAEQCDAQLELLHVVVDPADSTRFKRLLEFRLEAARIFSEPPIVTLVPRQHTIAKTIASHFESVTGGALVMSSEGHGRTAAFLGSVTTDVLVESFGPVVVVGPEVQIDRRVGGDLVVAVDGSDTSESVLALAGAWGAGLSARPWIVSVVEVTSKTPDVFGSAYPSRLAHRLSTMSRLPVEYEVIYGQHPAQAIADFAESIDAKLILASTRCRTGLARLAHGSVASALVRHARCPVVLMRPPSLPSPSRESGVAQARSLT